MKSGVLSAVFAAFCMASLGIFSRKIAVDATVVIFFRMAFGALFLLLFLFFSGKLSGISVRPTPALCGSGFFLAAFALCYFYALTMTTQANAVTVLYLAPLVSAIFSHFFLREKLTKPTLFLIVLAFFGFAVMLEFHFDFSVDATKQSGLLHSLLSMIFYAAFIVNNRFLQQTEVYNKTLCQLTVASLCLLPFAVGNMDDAAGQPASIWLWLGLVGFVPGFLGILLAVAALDKISAVTFGTISYLEPIFVILLGRFLFAEKLSTLQTAGCALILFSSIAAGIIAARNPETAGE